MITEKGCGQDFWPCHHIPRSHMPKPKSEGHPGFYSAADGRGKGWENRGGSAYQEASQAALRTPPGWCVMGLLAAERPTLEAPCSRS